MFFGNVKGWGPTETGVRPGLSSLINLQCDIHQNLAMLNSLFECGAISQVITCRDTTTSAPSRQVEFDDD